MSVDQWSDVLVLVACVVGVMVVVAAWPRRSANRGSEAPRETPPALPVAVKLDTIGDEARWRVANRHAILDVTVDIVTFRPAGMDTPWTSEPIVEPIALSPGRSTTLPSVIDDPTIDYDVAVAWTVHHLDEDAPGRRIFLISPDVAPPVEPVVVGTPGPMRGLAVVYGVVAALLCVGAVAAVWRLVDASAASSGVTAAPSSTTGPATTTTTMTTTTTTTPQPSTTTPAALTASTTSTSTTSTTTSTTTTSTTTTSTTTTSTTTTTATTRPSTRVAGPRVIIGGRIDRCQFGPDCLIASFRLDELPRAGNYVCEFADGSRVTFRYDGGGADDACSASGRAAAITIEVDGVRSTTITRSSPDGDL